MPGCARCTGTLAHQHATGGATACSGVNCATTGDLWWRKLSSTRLMGAKHDTKDAKRKAKHHSRSSSKVLLLPKDAQRFKIVQDDGSLGDVVDFDDLARLRQWMRDAAPEGLFAFLIKLTSSPYG